MRTVFVNPSRRSAKRKRSSGKKRRRMRRHNAGITSFVSNPKHIINPRRRRRVKRNPIPNFGTMVKNTGFVALGSLGGYGLNRLGLSMIPNFYIRNGARILGSAAMAALGGNHPLGASAAGAALSPLYAEIELKLSELGSGTITPTKTQQVAADLAAQLEADLEDDIYNPEGEDVYNEDHEELETW